MTEHFPGTWEALESTSVTHTSTHTHTYAEGRWEGEMKEKRQGKKEKGPSGFQFTCM